MGRVGSFMEDNGYDDRLKIFTRSKGKCSLLHVTLYVEHNTIKVSSLQKHQTYFTKLKCIYNFILTPEAFIQNCNISQVNT